MNKPNPSEHREWHSRGYLPHFDHVGMIQAITFRLADSLPKERQHLIDCETGSGKRSLREAEMNRGYGGCAPRNPAIAQLLEEVLLNRDGTDYRLLAWVVMPNHVHAVIGQNDQTSLSDIIQAWKSVSAKRCNALIGNSGRFWAPDYFDRYARDSEHLAKCIAYVHQNPVEAGLVERPEDWRWSSAWNERAKASTKPTHANGSF